MEEKNKKITKPNKNEMKIEAYHCYVCGKEFDDNEHKKTMHHAIAKRFKPDRNILIL